MENMVMKLWRVRSNVLFTISLPKTQETRIMTLLEALLMDCDFVDDKFNTE